MSSARFQPPRTNTILYCRHWAVTVIFYREQLGLEVAFENDWFVEFRLNDAAFVSIADARHATVAPAAGQGITLAWQIEALESLHAQLAGAGISVTPIRQKWGAEVFYCHDPEGHRLEFWRALAEA